MMTPPAQLHYVDYAATAPMRQVAIDAWVAAAGALNPAALHAAGRAARSILDDAREQVAQLLGCEPIEVIFTASGTEADNIALQGLYAAQPGAIWTTAVEHPAVRETVHHLASRGAQVHYLPVDSAGRVNDFSGLAQAARQHPQQPVSFATMMWANNETGVIQPVEHLVAAAGDIPVHVDAVQVVGRLDINFADSGLTTLAASAHKFGGPRGIGLLLARRTPAPKAVLFGGGQERRIRPGTVDVAGAAALAAALQESLDQREEETARIAALAQRLREQVLATVDNVVLNTTEPALAGHVHLSFPGADGDALLMLLDHAGIAASSGSACNAGVNRMSYVLEAMGISAQQGRASVRFSLGRGTTEADIDAITAVLPDIVQRARLS